MLSEKLSQIIVALKQSIKEGYLENDGWLDIKKVTIFIGNQGSGKSTVAKLISTFTWMEKALTRGDYDKKAFQNNGELRKFLSYHKIENYFKYSHTRRRMKKPDDSELGYVGDSYSFRYNFGQLEIAESQSKNYPLPQIMYFPADRNFLSSVDDLKTQRIFSPALSELLYEFDNSKKEMKGDLKLPINETGLEYEKATDTLYLKGERYKIKLAEASSGFQSFVPLFLVSGFLTNSVKKQTEIIEPMSSDELNRFKRGVTDIYSSENLTGEQKRAAISALSGKFNKSAFINIVEEPEQNLFPVSQWQMLKSLLEFNNMNEGNKLIMTTHSPYIINYLSIAIEGYHLKNKINKSEKAQDLLLKMNEIISEKSTISSDEVAIYQLNEADGSISKLSTFDGIPSDKNYLNLSIREGNELFDLLLAIEEEL